MARDLRNERGGVSRRHTENEENSHPSLNVHSEPVRNPNEFMQLLSNFFKVSLRVVLDSLALFLNDLVSVSSPLSMERRKSHLPGAHHRAGRSGWN